MTKDHLDFIIAWEEGELNEQDTIKLFQELVDNGDAFILQGAFGREAQRLIEAGLVKRTSVVENVVSKIKRKKGKR